MLVLRSESSLRRISALGADGGTLGLLFDVLGRVYASFLVYKTRVIVILQGPSFEKFVFN